MDKLTPLILLLFSAVLALPARAQAGDPPIPEDTVVQTTESGLQYSVLKEGSGTDKPKINDTVKVHYTGWLTTGKMFDSSRERGEPAEFPLSRVIAGWTEGLQLMSPGARFKFTIPPQIGYGFKGSPPVIPPDATLIFDVELIEITKRGREIPTFQTLPDDAQLTAGGIKYQILEPGSGEPCTPTSLVGLDFTIWTGQGQFMNSSFMQDAQMFTRLDKITLPFMPEIAPLFKLGSTLLLEVPYEKGAQDPSVPQDSPTIWRWTITNRFEVPSFSMPAEEELTATESGLKYKVISSGTGQQPESSSQVMCHYSGWLTDGKPFDSSYENGRPSTFAVKGVIKGWTEGLQLMKEGGKYLFVIPGELGYGARGNGAKIPPDATLVFVVELVKVI